VNSIRIEMVIEGNIQVIEADNPRIVTDNSPSAITIPVCPTHRHSYASTKVSGQLFCNSRVGFRDNGKPQFCKWTVDVSEKVYATVATVKESH
jgi:hypothetical protein